MTLDGLDSAGNEFVTHLPQSAGGDGVDSMRHNAELAGGVVASEVRALVRRHDPGHIHVLAIDTADVGEAWVGRTPHLGRRPLRDCLHGT